LNLRVQFLDFSLTLILVHRQVFSGIRIDTLGRSPRFQHVKPTPVIRTGLPGLFDIFLTFCRGGNGLQAGFPALLKCLFLAIQRLLGRVV
jgi:hypothetical protein